MEGFENLGVIIETCLENIPHVLALNRQAGRLAKRLTLFKRAFISLLTADNFLLQTEQVQKIKNFEKVIENLLDIVDYKLSVPISQWSSLDNFHVAIKTFHLITAEIVTISHELSLNIPLSFIVDSWQDSIDAYIDWMSAMSALENDGCSEATLVSFQGVRPLCPTIRKVDPTDIIEVHNINQNQDDTQAVKRRLYDDLDDDDDVDDDEDNTKEVAAPAPTAPPYTSAHLAVFSKAPVILKKIHADMVRGGVSEGGLLHLAHTYMHSPTSDYLLKAVGVVYHEADRLKTLSQYREENSDSRAVSDGNDEAEVWPSVIGIVLPLAPLGVLGDFLRAPPDEYLVDEKTLTPLARTAGGVLPPHVKASIIADVCSGLSVLHVKGIIHGRLHHNNVLIFQGCRAKLCDFGVAHILSPDVATESSRVVSDDYFERAKRGGIGMGWDVRWKAPEDVLRVYREPLDPMPAGRGGEARHSCQTTASDVYSLGMVMYSVITDGKKPFFNLPWEEAVINSLARGERPALPSSVRFSNALDPITCQPRGVLFACCDHDPSCRPKLDYVERTVKTLLSDLMFQAETRKCEELESDIRIAEMKLEVKLKKLAESERKSEKAHQIMKGKEDEMNAIKMVSEKRKVKAALDKARPKLDKLDAENQVMRDEIAANKKATAKIKAELTASQSRLVGGKNYMLRHLTWQDDYDMSRLFRRYAQKKDVNYLLKFCSPATNLQSLIYRFGAPLDVKDEIDEECLMTLCGGGMFGQGSTYTPDIPGIMFPVGGQEVTCGDTVAGVRRTSSADENATGSLGLFSGLQISGSAEPSRDTIGSAAPKMQRAKSTNLQKLYDNHDLMAMSELEQGIGRGDMWDWEGLSNTGKVPPTPARKRRSPTVTQFRSMSRHPEQSHLLVDLTTEYEDHDIQDEDSPDVHMDTPEVMVLAALRGDVQDAVGMYNVQESFELEYISKLVSAWQGNTQPGDEQVSSGSSPCHLAASLGHLTALRSLIENNSLSPDDPDNNGRTPIMMACAYGHLSVVRYLREVCKVNIESSDVESMTPILMAAMFGHHHIVKYLSRWLAHKSGQYHYADKELGGSILHWACLCGLSAGRLRMIGTCDNRYVETVRFIVKELKVPINARTSSDDSTPLAWACGAMPLTATKKKIVEMLVYYGADVHAVDNTGQTCLFAAAASGDVALVRILAEHFKVSLLIRDEEGKSAREVATGLARDYLKLRMRGKRFSLFSAN